MQRTYRIETTVSHGGKLILSDLPFAQGEQVEVVISRKEKSSPNADRYPLRGQPIEYDAPFDPVAEGEWEALLGLRRREL